MVSHMNSRRMLVASAALVAGALALSGCGAGGDSGGGSDGGDVTMSLWHNSTTGPGKDFWDTTVADFEAANPGVTIEIQSVQNEDLDGKLQTALNAGDAPDLFLQRGGGKMAAMVKAGQLKDLTDAISGAAKDEIPQAAYSANSLDGKIYALPVAVLPGGLFYSQDLFTQAGITETPTTMDEFDDAVSKLKDAGVAPVALGAKDAWPAAHWYYWFALRECSADTLAQAADEKNFDDECWIAAGEDLREVRRDASRSTRASSPPPPSRAREARPVSWPTTRPRMELMGAWDPGVISSLTPDAASRSPTSAGSPSRRSPAATESPAR